MPPKRTSNRRQFLTGRSALDSLADLAQGPATQDGDSDEARQTSRQHWQFDSAAQPHLLQVGRRAMACQFEVYLNAGQYSQDTEAALAALDLVEQLESQLSVYRDSSEIMHVNRAAADRPVPVEPRLFELLATAVELFEETAGAFDITSGPLSKVWGFHRRAGSVPDANDLAESLDNVGSDRLELDQGRSTVRFKSRGLEINLGSIGKGYALDRCAELMMQAGVNDMLWHGGQSSVLARGSCASGRKNAVARGADCQSQYGWVLGVRHPLGPNRRIAEIYLRDRAMGTSGSGSQFFRHRGKLYGHILDPRTGWPAEGVFSATVIAPSGAEADALATAFYVMGADAAMDYCRRHPQIATLMLLPSPGGTSIELVTAGLENDDWRLLEGPDRL